MSNKLLLLAINIIPLTIFSQEIDTLKKTIDNKIFHLGEVTISISQENKINDRITKEEIDEQNKLEVSKSLNMIAGVNLTTSGSRNESMVSIRGFDLRAIPVYVDGIPIYVPYDGYVDLARFTTFDLSAIDVSKGFSSMLYGPNSLGGAINLISVKPINKIEFNGALGAINSNGYRCNANIGSNLGKFYIQTGYSFLHRDSYILSKEFKPHAYENGGVRENSYRTDQKVSAKIGWTPNDKHEYVFGYINQHGEKGTPVYAGDDKLNAFFSKPRYWQWPAWDKETYYFLSNTKINNLNYIKTKTYYDVFKNLINSYDDSTYTTQKKPYAFQSKYNDNTYGESIEYGTMNIPKNELKLSVHSKEDVHKENNLGEPVRLFKDNTISFAIEDIYKIKNNLTIIPGMSYNLRKNKKAEDYDSKEKIIFDFPKSNVSKALNGQLGLFYTIRGNHKLSISISRKTRFATIKDRFSYRMGTAIPNPNLKPETADNYDITYTTKFFNSLSIKSSLFYSHITNAILNVNNVQIKKSQMQNIGLAEFKGIELSFYYNILNNLSIGSNYSYIERKNLSAPTLFFTDVPYSKIFSYIQYSPLKKVKLLVNSEYNSLRYSTSYGTKSPEFIVFNTIVSAKFLKYFSIEAGVNNILDKNYMLTEGYPEEGRNYSITLRFFNHY